MTTPEGRAGLTARLQHRETSCRGCGCDLAASESHYCADCLHDGNLSDVDSLRAFDAFHRLTDQGAAAKVHNDRDHDEEVV